MTKKKDKNSDAAPKKGEKEKGKKKNQLQIISVSNNEIGPPGDGNTIASADDGDVIGPPGDG